MPHYPKLGVYTGNPAEEMLPDVQKQHPDWNNLQLYIHLIDEIYKRQAYNLVWGCVSYCVAEALDHKAQEDYHQEREARS